MGSRSRRRITSASRCTCSARMANTRCTDSSSSRCWQTSLQSWASRLISARWMDLRTAMPPMLAQISRQSHHISRRHTSRWRGLLQPNRGWVGPGRGHLDLNPAARLDVAQQAAPARKLRDDWSRPVEHRVDTHAIAEGYDSLDRGDARVLAPKLQVVRTHHQLRWPFCLAVVEFGSEIASDRCSLVDHRWKHV